VRVEGVGHYYFFGVGGVVKLEEGVLK
jgi:hypothetical protein